MFFKKNIYRTHNPVSLRLKLTSCDENSERSVQHAQTVPKRVQRKALLGPYLVPRLLADKIWRVHGSAHTNPNKP